MKKLFTALMVVTLFATLSFAQVWKFDSDFAEVPQAHGVVVAPDGKIWTVSYGHQDTLITGTDTLITRPIYIYNEDGTLDQTLRIIGNDTLRSKCRGLTIDKEGNIIYTPNNELWKINYKTHELMGKFIPGIDYIGEPGVDDAGYLYVAGILGGHPLYIVDPDMNLFGYVTDTLYGIQRGCLASGDGNNIYVGKIYTKLNGIQHFKSVDGGGAESEAFYAADTFGTVIEYAGNDTLVHKMWGQCLDWDNNGLMWVGTYWNVDSISFTGWYALDSTQNWAVVDTLGHLYCKPGEGWIGAPVGVGAYYAPRGIAFSADGKTAYTADFDGGLIKKWTNPDPKGPGSPIIPLSELVVTSIDEGSNRTVVVNFDLKQNYPNPFNPTTTIPFDLKTAKHVVLKVYDMNGRLVSTLIDAKLMPGHHEYKFDGSKLASGTYIYQLLVDKQLVNKKMVLIK